MDQQYIIDENSDYDKLNVNICEKITNIKSKLCILVIMILNFSVENYKIFKQRTTLSMIATPDKSHPNNVYQVGEQFRVLKSTSIYGANASGKTKFFEAMELMSNFVRGSFTHIPGAQLNYTPFIYDEKSMKKPTSFEIDFIYDSRRYVYGFSYDKKKITEEHLFTFPNGKKKSIFERNNQDFKFNSDRKIQTENSKRVRENVLFVSVAAQFNHGPSVDVVKWFNAELYLLIGQMLDVNINNLVTVIGNNKRFDSLVKKALVIADFGISDIYDRNARGKRKDVVSELTATMVPIVSDIWVEHNVKGRKVELQLTSESSGTLRFLGIIGYVIESLLNGKTVVIDELDLSFHTDICQWVLGLFLDPEENKKGAQLIFNTHDVGLLDQEILRRDQIWFTSKDWETYESSMTRLSDYKGVRKDLDIRRAYLNGSFGSKPFIAPDRLME